MAPKISTRNNAINKATASDNISDRVPAFSPSNELKICDSSSNCSICWDNFINPKVQQKAYKAYHDIAKDEHDHIIVGYVNSIESDYAALYECLHRKGDSILHLWTKQFSTRDREEILRKAWPKSSQEQLHGYLRAFFEFVPDEVKVRQREDYRNSFLLPYLSLDAFVQDPFWLVQLLWIRRSRPSSFAMRDHEATRLGRHSGMLRMDWGETFYSLHENTYGWPTKFSSENFHGCLSVSFPVARILFESQCVLYKFLSAVVKLILKHDQRGSSGDKVFAAKANPVFGDMSTILRLPIDHFRNYCKFTLEEVEEPIYHRMGEVKEVLTRLQTDICVAHETAIGISGSSYIGSIASDLGDDAKWTAIALEMTQPLLTRSAVWAFICDEYEELKTALNTPESDQERRDRVKTRSEMPERHNHALASFSNVVQSSLTHNFRQHMKDLLLKHEAFDRAFASTHNGELVQSSRSDRRELVEERIRRQQDRQLKWSDLEHCPLLWAVTEFSCWSDRSETPTQEALYLLDDRASIDQVEGFPEDSRLVQAIVDISFAACVKETLKLHQPRFVDSNSQDQTGDRVALQQDIFGSLYPDVSDREQSTQVMRAAMTDAARLLKKFCSMEISPAPELTKPWIEKAILAKELLDEFWAAIREVRIQDISTERKAVEEGWTRENIEDLVSMRVLEYYKNPGILENYKADLAKIDAREKELKRIEEEERQHERAFQAEREARLNVSPKRPRRSEAQGPVKKVKRKHEERAPPQPEPLPALPPPPPPLPKEKIQVSRKSYNVLAHLWSNKHHKEGTVRFKNVVAALQDAGLKGESADGSACNFSHPTNGKKAQLHSPHGTGEKPVPKYWLMQMGREIEENFGWDWETFEERP